MATFKVGDRVRILDDSTWNYWNHTNMTPLVGKIGVVKRMYGVAKPDRSYFVDVPGQVQPFHYRASALQKIRVRKPKPAVQKFKEGDRVEILPPEIDDGIFVPEMRKTIGKVGFVTSKKDQHQSSFIEVSFKDTSLNSDQGYWVYLPKTLKKLPSAKKAAKKTKADLEKEVRDLLRTNSLLVKRLNEISELAKKAV